MCQNVFQYVSNEHFQASFDWGQLEGHDSQARTVENVYISTADFHKPLV